VTNPAIATVLEKDGKAPEVGFNRKSEDLP
jgi:hypothetical protein